MDLKRDMIREIVKKGAMKIAGHGRRGSMESLE
jgi:hypothetical protein